MQNSNNLKILYEDKDVLVVNKESGILVHRDINTKKEEITISDMVIKHDKSIEGVGESMEINHKNENFVIKRHGIVHRLDKETSGVMLIAKNQKSYLNLKEQFQNHKIKKIYRAFVYGHVSDPVASLASGKRGLINVPIGRSPNDIRMWTAGRGAKGGTKEAITEYIILNRFSTNNDKNLNQDNKYSYIEAYPKTGRTHQIRVHMRYINHPIVSDPLYRGSRDVALGINRLALHSHKISFKLLSGEEKTITAPLPEDFDSIITKYLA